VSLHAEPHGKVVFRVSGWGKLLSVNEASVSDSLTVFVNPTKQPAMKKIISKYLIPAFMLFVLLKPHAERIAFQGGNQNGAQYTQIQFEGTFGLPVPAVEVLNANGLLSDNRLELNSDYAVYSFSPAAAVQDGTVVTLQTRIDAVSLQSEASFSALPYDIYEVLNGFQFEVISDSLDTRSRITLEAVASYNQYGLPAQEIANILNEYSIPVTFSRDEISRALERLTGEELNKLISMNMIDAEGTPMWSISTVAELDIELTSEHGEIRVAYPLFPGYSEMGQENEFAAAFCSDGRIATGAAAHHMIDFTQFENLSEVIIRSGNQEQATTCLEGYRSNLANSYTISGPGLERNGFSEVLFVKS
jgi:hypothetical protein